MAFRGLVKQRQLTLLSNELLSNISHELKTPISTVSVALEAIDDSGGMMEKSKFSEYIGIARKELSRLTLLVENVLLSAQMQEKDPVLNFESLDLDALLTEVLASMQLQLRNAEANIELNKHGDTFRSMGDPIHLTGVLYNLIDNAIKYGPKAQTITIDLLEGDKEISLSVSDQGPGISREFREKVFEKFVRLPDSRGHVVKGNGLGLYYIKKVIEQHKGKILLQASASGGSKFILELKKADD